jgi:hypothetical protein
MIILKPRKRLEFASPDLRPSSKNSYMSIGRSVPIFAKAVAGSLFCCYDWHHKLYARHMPPLLEAGRVDFLFFYA